MIDGDYIQQLCAEQMVTKRNRNGFQVRSWEQIYARNEGLDCRNYSRAAAHIAGIDRFEDKHWTVLEEKLKEEEIKPVQELEVPNHRVEELVPTEATINLPPPTPATTTRRRQPIRSRYLS
jgi:phage terminase large subunit GpA-like protein